MTTSPAPTDYSGLAPFGYPPNPSKWRYNPEGYPRLTGEQIESISSSLLRYVAPECLIDPQPVPIHDLLARVVTDTGVKYCFANLGPKSDVDLRGITRFRDGLIIFDETLHTESAREQYVRFTIAHELGHWLLQRHRPIRLAEDAPVSESMEDTIANFFLQPGNGPQTTKQWVEWQANRFAASLVMPHKALRQAMVRINLDAGVNQSRAGYIYINLSAQGRSDARARLHLIAMKFLVSPRQVELRLESLGLLRRQMEESSSHPLYQDSFEPETFED